MTGPAKWDDAKRKILLKAVADQVKAGKNTGNGSLKWEGWRAVITQFNKVSGCTYTYTQLQNQLSVLKKRYYDYKQLLNNYEVNAPITPNNSWEKKVKELRNFCFYEYMHAIILATGAARTGRSNALPTAISSGNEEIEKFRSSDEKSLEENVTQMSTNPPVQISTRPPAPIVKPLCLASIVTKPLEPIVTKSPAPIVTKPLEPIVTKPPAPIVTNPPAQVVTEPPAPIVIKPLEPIVTKPPAQIVTNPPAQIVTKPPAQNVTEPLAPIVTKPLEPIVTKPLEPIVTNPPAQIVTKPTAPIDCGTNELAQIITKPLASIVTNPASIVTNPLAQIDCGTNKLAQIDTKPPATMTGNIAVKRCAESCTHTHTESLTSETSQSSKRGRYSCLADALNRYSDILQQQLTCNQESANPKSPYESAIEKFKESSKYSVLLSSDRLKVIRKFIGNPTDASMYLLLDDETGDALIQEYLE